jgi:predicted dehydrogenase
LRTKARHLFFQVENICVYSDQFYLIFIMQKVRIGVIGLGVISQAVHLPILSKFENAEIVAVSDVDAAKAKLVAEKYKVKKFFKDYRELLALPDLDAVIIATPTNMHRDIALDAIAAKKHVLVEKPLSRTAKEAKEILDALEKTDVKLMVGMNQRFRPDAMVMKSFLEGGEIGDIFFIKAGWLKKNPVDVQWKSRKTVSGGGVFLDLGIMVLDLGLWLMNFPKATSVSAVNFAKPEKQEKPKKSAKAAASAADSTSVEDFSSVLIRLENGLAMTVETSWNFEVDNDLLFCNAYGTDGFARVHPLRFNKKVHDSLVNVTPERIGSLEDIYKRSYQNELKHFLGAVSGLFPLTSTGREAYERMKIVDAIYKSSASGKEVRL